VGTGDGDFAEFAHPARTTIATAPQIVAKADPPRCLRSAFNGMTPSGPGLAARARDETVSHAAFDDG
jgi:hypothetical protein